MKIMKQKWLQHCEAVIVWVLLLTTYLVTVEVVNENYETEVTASLWKRSKTDNGDAMSMLLSDVWLFEQSRVEQSAISAVLLFQVTLPNTYWHWPVKTWIGLPWSCWSFRVKGRHCNTGMFNQYSHVFCVQHYCHSKKATLVQYYDIVVLCYGKNIFYWNPLCIFTEMAYFSIFLCWLTIGGWVSITKFAVLFVEVHETLLQMSLKPHVLKASGPVGSCIENFWSCRLMYWKLPVL